MAPAFKNIAWNGLQFTIPLPWELVWVDTHHLTFHQNGSPAMEIKWGPIKGRFSHRSQLKKIIKGHKANLGNKITKWPLPSTWKQALAGYSHQGFYWQADTISGHGATLYCPACNNAIIFQMFDIRNRLTDPELLQFCQTLSDHRDDDYTAWQVFDIQARVPKSLRLNRYQFKPGNHEITFQSKTLVVGLNRWAPASALLANTSLATFAADTLPLPAEQLRPAYVQKYPAVELQPQAATGWQRRLVRLGIKPAWKWVIVWHMESSNRILGISLESKKPFKTNQMEQFTDNFQLNPA